MSKYGMVDEHNLTQCMTLCINEHTIIGKLIKVVEVIDLPHP